MDEAKLRRLRTYYESLSDEALLAEAALGPDAFASEAWTTISEQIDLRGLGSDHAHRHYRTHETALAELGEQHPGRVQRLAARIDALPPSIKPAAFGALLIVMFAMARGAWIVLPVLVVYVLATSPDPGASLMTGVGIALLAMAGGALSGFAYSFVGRHLRTAVRGGYYLTGIVTLAPYMVVLMYIARLAQGVPLGHRLRGEDVAIPIFMTLLFGIVMGRAWFGPDEKGRLPSGQPNEALQLTSARAAEGLRLSACKDASASTLASRILSRPLAAELRR
jgi:hypothetical protein